MFAINDKGKISNATNDFHFFFNLRKKMKIKAKKDSFFFFFCNQPRANDELISFTIHSTDGTQVLSHFSKIFLLWLDEIQFLSKQNGKIEMEKKSSISLQPKFPILLGAVEGEGEFGKYTVGCWYR